MWMADEMEEDERPIQRVRASGKVSANLEPDREDSPEVVLRKNNFQSSTKLDALVRDLSTYIHVSHAVILNLLF
jgi:hypothetical protein